ncbi:chorismate mutase [Desulfolucanica intricata]|uniref:chorismate mutase n=1 Tax=Desulfolucanica intricata TaxID=1285191 RepID=UPI00082DCA17|nr:chorismate mutase [Desulfolucanica intricata]
MGNFVRGIRGAITVNNNTVIEIAEATQELLQVMVKQNEVKPEDIASVIFTVTSDLNAGFPAAAARQMGWYHVPMMGAVETNVPGSLEKCIRILMHINTSKSQTQIKHVYLRKAVQLRRDIK